MLFSALGGAVVQGPERSCPARFVRSPTVVFCGGGTGGHLTPGVSVARAIARMAPAARLVFLLTGRSTEAHFLSGEAGPGDGTAGGVFETHVVPAVRRPRGLFEWLRFPFRWRNVERAGRDWLGRLDPDVVVGLGGYGQGGPVAAARRMGLPVVLLEQNAVPGLANRLFARWAEMVCCQWSSAVGCFPRGVRVEVTGNPIRVGILGGIVPRARERFGLRADLRTLLVLGGSQGSRRLNRAMASAVGLLPELARTWQVVHQHGPNDGGMLAEAYASAGFSCSLVPFLSEEALGDAMAAADLVVSRAGATTLAELTALGKPSVLFPLPTRDGHQEANARVLLGAGACEVVADTGRPHRDGLALAEILCEVVEEPGKLEAMSRGSAALGVRDAAERVARLVLAQAGVCRVDR